MVDKKEEPKKPTHVVKSEFRDIANFDQVHEVGDDVSHFAVERLATLVANGHVEQVKAPEADPAK